MNFLPFSRSSLLGIDIHALGVHIVQCKKLRHGYLLENATARTLPSHIFNEGRISDWDCLREILSDLIVRQKMSAEVCLSLPVNLVHMQSIQLPADLKDKEIEAEINLKLRRDIPGLTDVLYIDFIKTLHRDLAYMDVFFVAAKQDYLWKYVETVNAIGLSVKIVDVDVYALKRALYFSLNWKNNREINSIVFISANHALLIISNEQNELFHQQWNSNEDMDFPSQLHYWIKQSLNTVQSRKVNNMMICATDEHIKLFLSQVEDDFMQDHNLQCYSPNPFVNMKLSNQLNCKEMVSSPFDFLIACGLVIREFARC